MLFSADIPPELALCILCHLPLSSLVSLRQLSHEWHQFFTENESYLYRNAAHYHNFIPSVKCSLDDTLKANLALMRGAQVSDWRTFCRLRYGLETNWAGGGSIRLNTFSEEHPTVHRIKVDEDVGIVITTHENGGLLVHDLETREIIWSLPATYVRQYAHCEYERGFLIFDRHGNGKEVWRLVSQYHDSPAPPEAFQQNISFTISQLIPPSKGHFKPWAYFTTPEPGRAFRFVYPTLASVGLASAYLYDVLTCKLHKTISNIQAPHDGYPLGNIRYVELSAQHVFICGHVQLRIFDRNSGALLRSITSSQDRFVDRGITVHQPQSPDEQKGEKGPPSLQPLITRIAPEIVRNSSSTEFVALHVDRAGRTAVAMLLDGRLLLIKDVHELVKPAASLNDLAIEVSFAPLFSENLDYVVPIAVYLAFEHGRVGLVTDFGIFILTLDSLHHDIPRPQDKLKATQEHDSSHTKSHLDIFPHVHCCGWLPVTQRPVLSMITCLQMTQTRLWLSWPLNEASPLQDDEQISALRPSGTPADDDDSASNSPTRDEFSIGPSHVIDAYVADGVDEADGQDNRHPETAEVSSNSDDDSWDDESEGDTDFSGDDSEDDLHVLHVPMQADFDDEDAPEHLVVLSFDFLPPPDLV